MSNEKTLYSPLKIGLLNLKNRIALAPMTRARAGESRVPNAVMAEYYAQRSSAGLLLSEATTISSQANGWNQSPGIYADEMVEGWKIVNKAVHAQGGVIFCQLWHCGRASHSSFHNGQPAVAPSAIKINGDYIHTPIEKEPYEIPRALETTEIPQIIADYKQAAINAKAAGFDGVEIHCANGYLIDTFLQSKTNHRTDIYGGNKENRTRLLEEIIETMQSVWPKELIGVRISPNGVYNDMGSPDFREQFLYVASRLNLMGVAYLHVMDGLGFGFHNLGEPMTLNEFRGAYNGMIMGNCGYVKETAEAAISSGAADMISIGRPYISNPDLVERYKNNWPLNPDARIADWYAPTGAEGYTTFPMYKPNK